MDDARVASREAVGAVIGDLDDGLLLDREPV